MGFIRNDFPIGTVFLSPDFDFFFFSSLNHPTFSGLHNRKKIDLEWLGLTTIFI